MTLDEIMKEIKEFMDSIGKDIHYNRKTYKVINIYDFIEIKLKQYAKDQKIEMLEGIVSDVGRKYGISYTLEIVKDKIAELKEK